jgi:hypothetical protein
MRSEVLFSIDTDYFKDDIMMDSGEFEIVVEFDYDIGDTMVWLNENQLYPDEPPTIELLSVKTIHGKECMDMIEDSYLENIAEKVFDRLLD